MSQIEPQWEVFKSLRLLFSKDLIQTQELSIKLKGTETISYKHPWVLLIWTKLEHFYCNSGIVGTADSVNVIMWTTNPVIIYNKMTYWK
jgi:hypothetical protein